SITQLNAAFGSYARAQFGRFAVPMALAIAAQYEPKSAEQRKAILASNHIMSGVVAKKYRPLTPVPVAVAPAKLVLAKSQGFAQKKPSTMLQRKKQRTAAPNFSASSAGSSVMLLQIAKRPSCCVSPKPAEVGNRTWSKSALLGSQWSPDTRGSRGALRGAILRCPWARSACLR
ncbi:MAG: hypothetical protein ACI97B_001723, partial [Verrucomicrobiales bacterium]